MNSYALNQYKQTNVAAGAAYADPHALIGMLLNGLQEKIAVAKGAMQRKQAAEKGEAISKAIAILDYLQSCLDREKGGQLAETLDALYAYMGERLFQANFKNDPVLLEEVSVLIKEIKNGWEAIRQEVNRPLADFPEVEAS